MRDRRTGLSYQVIHKHRPSSWCSQWPSAGQVQTARQLGFNILPIGFRHPKKAYENPDHELEWQIAFTKVIITLIEEDSSLPCVSSLKSTISVWFIDVSIMFPLIPNHIVRPRRFLPRGCISPSFGFISLPFSSWKHILRPMTASTSFISGLQINCQTIRVLDRYIDNWNLFGQKNIHQLFWPGISYSFLLRKALAIGPKKILGKSFCF